MGLIWAPHTFLIWKKQGNEWKPIRERDGLFKMTGAAREVLLDDATDIENGDRVEWLDQFFTVRGINATNGTAGHATLLVEPTNSEEGEG